MVTRKKSFSLIVITILYGLPIHTGVSHRSYLLLKKTNGSVKNHNQLCIPKKIVGAAGVCTFLIISFLMYKNYSNSELLSKLQEEQRHYRVEIQAPATTNTLTTIDTKTEGFNSIILRNKGDEYIFVYHWMHNNPRLLRTVQKNHHVWMHILNEVGEAQKIRDGQ